MLGALTCCFLWDKLPIEKEEFAVKFPDKVFAGFTLKGLKKGF